MNAELKLNKILSEVQKLDKTEQMSLLKRLTVLINNSNRPEKKVKLTDMGGLGSEIWNNTDIDKYVDDERQW